jgi:hypothetical protein
MKIGLCLRDFGWSQLAYLAIKQGNTLAEDLIDVVGFFENGARPCITPCFGLMHIAEAYGFDGTLIATSLSTAEKVIRFPSAFRKYFYVWDLEWHRQIYQYETLVEIYRHPELTLLARGEEHAEIIRKAWNKEVVVIDDFNLKELCSI